tara:strand:- start:26742 stop:27860 length:1119 start_codon:yes stop_codon:yes gene_type:complete
MENTNKNMPQKYSNHENEIDLVALAKILWEGRNEVVKISLIFVGIGLVVALSSPAEYTSTVVVKPTLSDSKSKLSGSLGGLAAMAGINLGGASSAAEIHPTLYPKIVESYSFQKELMESPVYVKDLNSEVSFEQYYSELHSLSVLEFLKKYTLGLPRLIINYFKNKKDITTSNGNMFQIISETDKEMIEKLKEQVRVNIDEKQGFVKLSATMPERLQAAQMVLSAQNILQRKVINHKLKKAEEDLGFIEERYNEKKKAFEQAQGNLAKYRDANRNVNTATAQTEAERLESEYQLAFSVYSELAKQVETQKIQVKENTPVFAVLQDAVVPLEKSSTSKSMTLAIWAFLGLFVGVAIIFAKTFITNIKEKWEAS